MLGRSIKRLPGTPGRVRELSPSVVQPGRSIKRLPGTPGQEHTWKRKTIASIVEVSKDCPVRRDGFPGSENEQGLRRSKYQKIARYAGTRSSCATAEKRTRCRSIKRLPGTPGPFGGDHEGELTDVSKYQKIARYAGTCSGTMLAPHTGTRSKHHTLAQGRSIKRLPGTPERPANVSTCTISAAPKYQKIARCAGTLFTEGRVLKRLPGAPGPNPTAVRPPSPIIPATAKSQ